jgi:hypothetical protein
MLILLAVALMLVPEVLGVVPQAADECSIPQPEAAADLSPEVLAAVQQADPDSDGVVWSSDAVSIPGLELTPYSTEVGVICENCCPYSCCGCCLDLKCKKVLQVCCGPA